MARAQLERFMRTIFDPDVIDPEPLARLRVRLLRQEIDGHPDGDPVGNGSVLEQLFHTILKVAILGSVTRPTTRLIHPVSQNCMLV